MTSNESNDLFKFLKDENVEHNNERRMIEINTYYSEKYKAYGKLALKITYCLFPIIMINILLKYDMVPRSLGHILLSLIVGISGFYIFFDILSISFRDNINFDAYDWQYDIRNLKSAQDEEMSGDNNIVIDSCIDEQCCDKETQIYDKLKAKCVTKVKEGFISLPKRSGVVEKKGETCSNKLEYMCLGSCKINERCLNE